MAFSEKAREAGRHSGGGEGSAGGGDNATAGIGDECEFDILFIRGGEFAGEFEETAFHGVDDDEVRCLPEAHAHRFGREDSGAITVVGRDEGAGVFESATAGTHDVGAGFELADAVVAAIVRCALRDAADGLARSADCRCVPGRRS